MESEAKKLFCPHLSTSEAIMIHTITMVYQSTKQTMADDKSYNDTTELLKHRCRGSGCMAWQTDQGEYGHCGLMK